MVNKILGRSERDLLIVWPVSLLADQRVLITGAAGSIGTALTNQLKWYGIPTLATDTDTADVTAPTQVFDAVRGWQPDLIFHLAGAKHAPACEEDPHTAAQVNAIGTWNVLAAAEGRTVVTASSCKACEPETAYGASKLLAERITLNAQQRVARFHNVVETQGNVFEIWRQTDGPLPVTPCSRYFISLREALALLLWTAVLPPARYSVDPGQPRRMADVAADLYPDREHCLRPPRRGDRLAEPLHASYERALPLDHPAGLLEISSPHDHAIHNEQSFERRVAA